MSDIVFNKEAAPLTPPSGQVSLYVKPDGILYRKDETGTETAFVAAGDLGSAAFDPASAFDAAGAAAAAQAASDPVGSAATVLASSLQKASNLSDIASASTARTNLGLGTAATHAETDFDSAGAASAVFGTSLQKASNLSDLGNASTARTNLGLGTAATQASSAFDAAGAAAAVLSSSLQKTSNLSDLSSASTARTNLGLGTSATHAATDFDSAGSAAAAQAASDPAGTATSTMTAHNAASDPHNQYLLASGTRALTGDLATGGHKISGLPAATTATEPVTFAQWQASLSGTRWLIPVLDPVVQDDTLNTPPGSPTPEQSWIVGTSPTGAWSTFSGRLVGYWGGAWHDILGRAVQVGDRIGVAFEGGTPGGGLSGKANQIATITSATPGSIAYSFYTPATYDATWTNATSSEHFGDSYNYNGSTWAELPHPQVNYAGSGLVVAIDNTWSVDVDGTTIQINGSNQLNVPSGVFDAYGAATTAQGNSLQKASNLSDLANAATARTNLGLGSAATQASSAFDTAGAAATAQSNSLQKASNLSDLASAATARTNLGLGTAATQASSAFDAAGAASTAQSNAIAASCQRASNLSDVASASTARTNLGLGTAALNNTGDFDASGAASTAQAYAIQRANHTGTQLAATISDFASAVLADPLTGYSAGANTPIAATDTVNQAFGKTQGQINALITDQNTWNELITTVQLNSTSNTTLTNIAELAQACLAGHTYRIEATIIYQTAATGTGITLTMGTSDTAAGTLACSMRTPTGTNGTSAEFAGAITSLANLVTTTGVRAANTGFIAKIEGIFKCTTSGTLNPQFRSSVNGSQVSIMVGSVMLYRIW